MSCQLAATISCQLAATISCQLAATITAASEQADAAQTLHPHYPPDQCSIVQCSVMQCSIVQCTSVQCSAVKCIAGIQCSILLLCLVL